MRDSSLYLYGLGVTLVLFCGFAIHLLTQEEPETLPRTVLQERPDSTMPLMRGFSYRGYDADQLVNELEADELQVNPRRLGFFNVRKVNELTLTNARFRVFRRDNAHADADPLSMLKRTLAFQGGEGADNDGDWPKRFGLITRQVIVGLDQEIYDGDALTMRVRASQVYIDRRNRNPEYLDATFSDPRSQQRIVCKKAIWDKQNNVFRIPGVYLLSGAGEQQRGRRIRVSMDFSVSGY